MNPALETAAVWLLVAGTAFVVFAALLLTLGRKDFEPSPRDPLESWPSSETGFGILIGTLAVVCYLAAAICFAAVYFPSSWPSSAQSIESAPVAGATTSAIRRTAI